MVKILIDLEYIHTCISKDTVKELGISLKLIKEPFKVFNADSSQSGHKLIMNYMDITLDTEGHKKQVEAVVTTLDSADIFLEHNCLTCYNPEIN
ncbi:hypothetical protein AN958_09798 [Leucoagaricus sp. SymC.cos]|nr:hypothetical protein AN958_09798 [Leucoagaricus sp. SymC.cos]